MDLLGALCLSGTVSIDITHVDELNTTSFSYQSIFASIDYTFKQINLFSMCLFYWSGRTMCMDVFNTTHRNTYASTNISPVENAGRYIFTFS